MRFVFSVIFCCLSMIVVAGQQNEELRIQLFDEEGGETLSDVMVKSFDDKGNLKSYTMTDGDGSTSVSLSADYIICSYLGYKELKIETSSLDKSANNKLYMEKSAVELKEIIVKAPPIREKSDTIVYNVDAFKSQGDRYLQDILRRLPGISVGSDGRISYQGESISKFYIEGNDLLGYNYNQATESLPVDAVANVEILEHNQNVKVLKGKVFEKKAAVNIRLNKDYR